jgi:hypothetical protein
MRHKHSFSMYVPNDAPTWMTGIVIVAAIIMGTFMFERAAESGDRARL